MKVNKVVEKVKEQRFSMRSKLIVSLSAIAAVLLISCVISIMEYTRMSDYVSDLVSDDIDAINVANKLAEMSNTYNLSLLAVIGDEISAEVPDFDDAYFKENCDKLSSELSSARVSTLADSVLYSYSAYMLTSFELQNVLVSDFIDSRSWYFERLQPKFQRLQHDIDVLSDEIYTDLRNNSATFDRGYYRSIIPGLVAAGVGLLLIIMLLFFIISGYVNPIYKMLESLNAYRGSDKKYTYQFDGDDQLAELNAGITEITQENAQLRTRVLALRHKTGSGADAETPAEAGQKE